MNLIGSLLLLVGMHTITALPLSVYKSDGDYIIGAILPLSAANDTKKCAKPNLEGIAHAEAIVYAINLLNEKPAKNIGYDIRDSCSDAVIARDHANSMNSEAIAYIQDSTKPKPVNVVISSFTQSSKGVMDYLNIENIPQLSYSPDNARLKQDSSIKSDAIKGLISSYPISTNRIKAIADVIKHRRFQYVYTVVSDDYQGKSGYKELHNSLSDFRICTSKNLLLSDTKSITKAIKTVNSNPLVKIVVVHANQKTEEEFYKALNFANMTGLILLTTRDWSKDLKRLISYEKLVEGMVYVSETPNEKFKTYMGSLNRKKIVSRPWLKPLFTSTCIRTPLASTTECTDQEAAVMQDLQVTSAKAIYSVDAVYTAFEVQKKLKSGTAVSFNKAIQGLVVRILSLDNRGDLYTIVYDDHLVATQQKFKLYNMRLIAGELKSVLIGYWSVDSKLNIDIREVRWKDQSRITPVSACSLTCHPGFRRKFPPDIEKCCWTCESCPDQTASNVTNANECITCISGYVAHPNKTSCIKYRFEYFRWSSGMGSFIIFLIVLGCFLLLFALVIFTRNIDHDIVKVTSYKLLLLFLLGLLLVFLSPIPLLLRPTLGACSAYIFAFNIGLTMLFSVLIARSAFINKHYNDNGELVLLGCCGAPRTVAIFLCLLVQILILGIGLETDPPDMMYNETSVWNLRWFECSNWASYIWWISFGLNIVFSIIGNALSCTSTKIMENYEELRYIIITYLMFYLAAAMEIMMFYQYVDKSLEEGQAVMTFVFGSLFYITFISPKLYAIVCRTEKDGTTLQKPILIDQDEAEHIMHTGLHASDPYRHCGIVQVKFKE